MYLTGPQSSSYDAARFEGRSPLENQFDWDLYYRFKDQRERFWRQRIESDSAFRATIANHLSRFHQSVEDTLRLLQPIERPEVLDIGLGSEQLDRAVLTRTGGRVAVLDLQPEAAFAYQQAFGGRGVFILDDVISFARDAANAERFDLVYSMGLIEHFPDKADILHAHRRLVRRGGLMLIYVPIDTEANRALTQLAPEWENFGYRELLSPPELRDACAHPDFDILSAEPVGLLSAVWARKRASS